MYVLVNHKVTMMRVPLFFVAFSFLYIQSFAGTNIRTSVVRYASGKDTVQAYLCLPEGRGPFPAVVVIHEWWGLNDWIKENARTFAERGYAALAIDLYRGKSTSSPDEAHELMRGLPEDRAARDLKAAVSYLGSRDDVKKDKIGSVGWCMGGGYSLAAATTIPELASAVVCYGRLVTDTSTIKAIHASLLGIFGENDAGIPPESVKEFESACKAAGKNIAVTIYPKAGHAFMNPNNAKGYRKVSAKDAWGKIWSFFESTLKQ